MKLISSWKRGTAISLILLVSTGTGLLIGFQNCSKVAFEDIPQQVAQASVCEQNPNDPSCREQSCVLDGQTVLHGQSVPAYSNRAVQAPSSCESIKAQRTCMNGVLEGNQTYQYAKCVVSSLKSCFIQGHEILHGGSVTAYQSQSYQCGSKPVSETRNCHDGVLSGSYPYVGTPTMVGGQAFCPAQTLTAQIYTNDGTLCVQNVPQSPVGAQAPRMFRYAEHGPNCPSAAPGETPYYGTVHFPAHSTRAGQVCENYCGVNATCTCAGTWEVKDATW